MKCDACSSSFTDGVFCNGCLRNLDFSCASISETGYRKLGADRRAMWRCPQCKVATGSRSPTVSESGSITLEMIMSELREMKSQLRKLPELFEDIKTIKKEISELKVSCEFNSSRMDDLESKIKNIEKHISESQKIESSYTKDIALLKSDSINREQWSHMNNVEIKGILVKPNENLFTYIDSIAKVVNYPLPKTQVNYIARVPSHGTKEKSIIVSFINRYIKEEFIAATRARKRISLNDIGMGENDRLIYVNDHLVPDMKKLLTRVKEISKLKGLQYVWVKFCKIHVRKNDRSPVFIISNEADLNKLA